MAALTPPIDISEAKAKLSALMTQAIHEHAPIRVTRRGEDDQLVGLARGQVLDRLLGDELFPVEMTVEAAEFIAAIPALGQLGTGETVDEALLDLQRALDDFVTEFFSNLRFWEQTTRIAYYRPLLRYLLMDPGQRLLMLSSDDAVSSAGVQSVGAHADA